MSNCNTSPFLIPAASPTTTYMNGPQILVTGVTETSSYMNMQSMEVLRSIVTASHDPKTDAMLSDNHSHESCQSSDEDEPLRPEFDATRCLFCHVKSSDFDSNVSHMFKSHGFRVPEQQRLRVDLETFYDYLDLIISGYAQCLYCGTERNNSHGARHHMLAKNHCQIDITGQDSEFREFYDWELEGDNATPFVQLDETTLRLSSGKVLSDRSVRPKHHRGRRSPDAASTGPELMDGSADSDSVIQRKRSSSDQDLVPLSSSEKRDTALFNQLARLRQSDRTSLAHLPVSQQRAQLLVQKKQMDQAKRSQQTSDGLLEQKGNKTSVKNFVPDTRSRKGDHHHGKIWTP